MTDENYTTFPYDSNMFLWVTYEAADGQTWYITSDTYRREYYLFKGKKQTRYKSANPCDLYEHIKDKGAQI